MPGGPSGGAGVLGGRGRPCRRGRWGRLLGGPPGRGRDPARHLGRRPTWHLGRCPTRQRRCWRRERAAGGAGHLGRELGLLGLSIAIAILGIVNTLILSVSERVREIGLMRAVGLGRAQLAGQIVCESVLTAVYGTVLGAGAGVLLAGALRALLADRGLTELVIPWARLGAVLGVSVVVGVLAALWPAARATRLPVLEAIAAE